MPTVRLGDVVRIKSGAFASFAARIEGINQARSLLKVKVDIYGRPYPVTIKFSEAEKVAFTGIKAGDEQS